MDTDLQALARRFAQGAHEFASCPLYQQLCRTVAADERLLAIAAERRVGQQPTNLLLAAVQYLLFEEPTDELARWYVSMEGARARPPETAGPAFTSFCLRHRDPLVELLHTKLVQTNVVKRAAALRLGLAHIARRVDSPVTLIEIGASAGVLLAFDRYGYRLAGRVWGRPDSTLEIATDWRATPDVLPDLDRIPPIAQRLGIDISPIDPRDLAGRRWLRALVWPGNEPEWTLLERALDLVVVDPARVIVGDAIEVLPRLRTAELPSGGPLVVFHAATRAHLPIDRREAFDQTILDLGKDRPLFWLSLEGTREPLAELGGGSVPLHLLRLVEVENGREQKPEPLAIFEPHAEWAMPLAVPGPRHPRPWSPDRSQPPDADPSHDAHDHS